jgi:ABC-type transport system involved in multi-copper enzyme maturation permease subunit
MLSLFRAEWLKISGNRIPTAVFVWIYPISAFMLLVFAAIAALVSEPFRNSIIAQPPDWTQQLLFPWVIINTEIGRIVLVCFAGEAFGGEYQRMMWKNLLPRRQRVALILNKFLTLAVFVLSSFILMCIIVGIGVGIVAALAGAPYVPSLSELGSDGLRDFLRQFGAQAAVAFAAALIAAAYAALGGIATRSILGAIVLGGLFTFAEQGILLALFLISNLTNTPDLLQLYTLTPGYNLANISSWSQYGSGFVAPVLQRIDFAPFSVELSTLIVLAWLVGLIGLTVWLFQRQDVTS